MDKKIYFLIFIALFSVGVYLFGFMGEFSNYALKNRSLQIASIVIVGICIAVSSIVFQTISNNKILTPSIIGLDSLYMLLQSCLVFILGSTNLIVYKENINFLLSLFCMVIFSLLLYKLLFKNERNIYLIMLLGIIFGTFFSALGTFFEVLIDPDEFMIIQGRMFASFDNIAIDVLFLASIITLISMVFVVKYLKFLDPLVLGKDLSINLGINYHKIIKHLMIIVAILTSISTALVGPITFLGLLICNITYELFKTSKHKFLLLACSLIAIIFLIIGVFFVSRVFEYNTTISVIINFLGGIYFLYLVFKGSKL